MKIRCVCFIFYLGMCISIVSYFEEESWGREELGRIEWEWVFWRFKGKYLKNSIYCVL